MKDRTKNSIKPFWSWNDKLEKAELERQIEAMKKNGIEGFFMHARGGLRTEYMSDEWFNMIEACLDKADELGMQAWAYDENGWPSGFANGAVPKFSPDNQQKSLNYIIFDGTNMPQKDRILACYQKHEQKFTLTDTAQNGSYIFYYKVFPHYIDVFNKDTIADFLRLTHDKYFEKFGERFGNSLKGFFTDEPQYADFPWSNVFPEEFKKEYGYSLIENLPALAFDTENCVAVRSDYNNMVARLMRESFIKQMYDWCDKHNCKLTGHMMSEETLGLQSKWTGGVMACYDYFHEPGIDHLCRKINSPCLPKQLGSVASQLDKKTLTETFALCGWDVSPNELKWMAQWQYVNGVTSLCPHLESYTLRGNRKRDYPASLFTQLPWFDEFYLEFANYFTSLGTLLDSGKDIAPVLLLQPMQTAHIYHILGNNKHLEEYSQKFNSLTWMLNNLHILHHYGDEILMEKYGSLKDGKFYIGKCEYETILLPNALNLKDSTVKLLTEFINAGGKVYALESLPKYENGRMSKNITALNEKLILCKDLIEFKQLCKNSAPIEVKGNEPDSIHLNVKTFSDGRKLLYATNNTKKEQNLTFEIQGEYALYLYDILAEKKERLSTVITKGKTITEFTFAEYGSAVIFLEKDKDSYQAKVVNTETIALKKLFDVKECTNNAITLDKCKYRIDGGDWHEEMAVINLFNDILELQKPCDVELQFSFNISEQFDFDSVKLCMEDPGKFNIHINGSKYSFIDNGMYIDTSFRTSNIGNWLKLGKNTVTLSCRFTQSPELYYAKFTPGVHKAELNKLTYDTELESIYIIGDFGVLMDGDYHYGERRCIHAGRNFSLIAPTKSVDITDITPQGFWFFSGKLSLSQIVKIKKTENRRYIIKLEQLNAPAIKVLVNGKFAGNIAFAPFTLEVTDLLKYGENEIVFVMLSGNRNLLGPHHRPSGESYSVGPDTFSNKTGLADDATLPPWTDDYNFVVFGARI